MGRKAKRQTGAGRAVGYIRVSTAAQATEGLSLDAQRSRIEAAALAGGLELVGVVVDGGVSGSVALADRPGGAQVVAMVEAGQVAAVIVAKLDRLGRSAADLLTTVQGWERRGVALQALDVGVDTTSAAGRVFFGMLSVFAEFERGQASERTRAGLLQAKAEGATLGGAPMGLERTDDVDAHGRRVLVAVPAQQLAVARLVALRGEGMPWRAVADALNREGVPAAKGGAWHAMAAKRIFDRAAA